VWETKKVTESHLNLYSKGPSGRGKKRGSMAKKKVGRKILLSPSSKLCVQRKESIKKRGRMTRQRPSDLPPPADLEASGRKRRVPTKREKGREKLERGKRDLFFQRQMGGGEGEGRENEEEGTGLLVPVAAKKKGKKK